MALRTRTRYYARINSSNYTRRFALSSVLVALLAVTLGAQVAGASDWTIKGKTLSELKLSEESTSVSSGAIKISVPSLSATTECLSGTGSGKILAAGTSQFSLSLKSCSVSGVAGCTVSEPLTIKGKAESTVTDSLYDKVTAQEGETLATIVYTGKSCTLPKESKLTGSFAIQVPREEAVEYPLTASESISKEANAELVKEGKAELSLKSGEKEAHLSGEMKSTLSGANASQPQVQNGAGWMCEEAVVTCPAGKRRAATTTIVKMENEVEMRFTYGANVATCQSSIMKGPLAANAVVTVSLTTVQFTTCGLNCNTSVTTPMTMTMFPLAIPRGGGYGLFRLSELDITLNCFSLSCSYQVETAVLDRTFLSFSTGTTAKYQAVSIPMKLLAGAGCPATGTWSGVTAGNFIKYKFTEPTPFFITF
jgi:hypothetical protein